MIHTIENIIFILLILFLIIEIILIIKNRDYLNKNKYGVANGIIENFYKDTSSIFLNDGESYKISPIISYEVNGKPYQFVGDFYTTSMKKGDNIKILFNKENPQKAKVFVSIYFAHLIMWIFIIMIIVTLLVIKRYF